jgi:hypothetical protein
MTRAIPLKLNAKPRGKRIASSFAARVRDACAILRGARSSDPRLQVHAGCVHYDWVRAIVRHSVMC